MTHKNRILSAIEDGQWKCCSALASVYYGFSKRISDLEHDGFVIDRRPCEHGNKHADDYRLAKWPHEKERSGKRFRHTFVPVFRPYEPMKQKQGELF